MTRTKSQKFIEDQIKLLTNSKQEDNVFKTLMSKRKNRHKSAAKLNLNKVRNHVNDESN